MMTRNRDAMTNDRSASIEMDAALARRIDELSPTKRALLEQQLRARAIQRGAIPPRALGAPAPASFGQELLWRLNEATPGLYAYNVARAMRLTGRLDRVALQRALDLIVARHAVLRTRFADVGGEVMQVLDPPASVPVETLTLESAADERARELEAAIAARVRRPFDLAHEGQFRVTLVRGSEQEHVLLWVSHHIALDGWSASLLLREFADAYAAFARGSDPALREAPIAFADFALWQREWLSGERLERLLAFWRERLDGIPELIALPSDWPRPQVQRFQGGQATTVLSAESVRRMRELAQRHGVTVYMVLLAAYATLLSRYSAEHDIAIGSPIAGRTRPETEAVVGYFANMLVHRNDLSGDPTFAELLERVRTACMGAFEHQDVPLEKLIVELRRDRQLGHAPLFQCAMTMEDAYPEPIDAAGLRVESLELDSSYAGAAKFDLLVLVREQPQGLRLLLEYRTDLFSADTARRILGHLAQLIDDAAAHPERRLSELAILTFDEDAALERWNATGAELPRGFVHERFLAHADRTPEAVAVRCGGDAMTYDALRRRAASIAAALEKRGVGKGARVGIALGRSIDMIASVLGVLMRGAAYVPLAPDLPAPRLARQIAEAEVAIVIASRDGQLDALAGSQGQPVVVESIEDAPVAAMERVGSDDAAYVLFTSGSTGTPKGVAVTHANIANYTAAVSARLGASDGAHWSYATVSTLSADLGNTALFPALCNGATLHVVPEEISSDGIRFADYASANRIDVLKITPSHLRALMSASPEGARGMLPRHWIVLGGEPFDWSLADHLVAIGSCRVLNHYGPTEATVGAATFEVTRSSAEQGRAFGAQTVPIGAPLANVSLHVLDAHGARVPVGVAGELFVGGAGVAAGYVGRPDMTGERFVSMDGEPGRVYRTGDRVRRLPDGSIEFLGRTDGQIKVRGFRVELGEIESVLARHPGVTQAAVVLAQEDVVGAEPALASFVVARSGDYAAAHAARPTPDALREWIASELPDYMIPTLVEIVESIPLTPNGKRDHAALRARVLARSAASAPAFVAPRSETEAALSAIWGEVFKRDRVGVTDNFLSLGGQSLLAIRVLGKMSRHFGVRLPLRSLFDAPTVEQLAVLVDGAVEAARPPAANE